MKKTVKTPRHLLELEFLHCIIPLSSVRVEKELFSRMCKEGCVNFNNKYSCPPFSPDFKDKYKGYYGLFAVLLSIDLAQLDGFGYAEAHKLRLGNAVIKPRLERLMRRMENMLDCKYISTGACRLCKPCRKKLDKPCAHPLEMRYSLESMGVDCNDLVEKNFGRKLLWYKDKKAPAYTSVVCALPLKKKNSGRDLAIALAREIDALA